MPDCELISTCPYFNDEFYGTQELKEGLKEEYCRGEYGWCGRYMVFKAQEREMERTASGFAENAPKAFIGDDACIHSDMRNQGYLRKIRSLNSMATGWDDP